MFTKARACLQVVLVLLGILVLNGILEAQVRSRLPRTIRRHDAVLKRGVHVLNRKTLSSLARVSEEGSVLVFRHQAGELDRIMGGDVIVCGTSEMTPYGMLRRVIEVSETDAGLVMRTEQATLEDVFWAGRIRESIQMSMDEISEARTHRKGVRIRGLRPGALVGEGVTAEGLIWEDLVAPELVWSPGSIEMDFLDVVLLDLDEDLSTTNDQVTLSGKAGVQPSFDIDLDVFGGKVEEFRFINTNELYDKLELQGYVNVPLLDESVTIATFYFNPVVIMAGPVPLVFTPILEMRVGARGNLSAGVSTSATVGFSATAGIIYENQQWRGITELPDRVEDIRAEWDLPRLSIDVNAQAYAGPHFMFFLYGVAGPFASVHGYIELGASLLPDPNWALFAGVRGTIGLASHIPVIGPSFTLPVFDEKWRIAQGTYIPH